MEVAATWPAHFCRMLPFREEIDPSREWRVGLTVEISGSTRRVRLECSKSG